MSTINRLHLAKRYSEASIHNGTIYLAGQVADDATEDIAGQTAQVLAAIDRLLADAGSDKSRLLMVQIFLADMADFDGMNSVWDAWVSPEAPPRATVQARLARAGWRIEIVATAAA
jgi:enamine deaminase RidA (YjgF/YER057c/UK114 family)